MSENARNEAERLPFFGALTGAEKERVLESAVIRSYEAGSVIHSRENECLGIIRVLHGTARTFMFSPEGREITLYRIERGDLDVLSAACVVSQIRFETQMTAETDCTLLILPVHCVSVLKENNMSVRSFIFEKLGERFSDAMLVMQEILFVPVEARIARWIAVRTKRTESVVATHEEIARGINSSREVISRILKRMERDGVVRLERGRIVIADRDALEDLAA